MAEKAHVDADRHSRSKCVVTVWAEEEGFRFVQAEEMSEWEDKIL